MASMEEEQRRVVASDDVMTQHNDVMTHHNDAIQENGVNQPVERDAFLMTKNKLPIVESSLKVEGRSVLLNKAYYKC